MLAETKIDDSFLSSQFHIEGYHPPFRKDRTICGGGLLLYVRSDIPCRQLGCSTPHVESICVELFLEKKPWFLGALYKSPGKVKDIDFTVDMERICE